MLVLWLGFITLSALLAVTLLAFAGLIGFSQQGPDLSLLSDSYFHGILSFSIKQALLSALLSVLLAIPLARLLYYQPKLPGRGAFLSLCTLCFVMPTLVLVTGLVSLFGQSGWLAPIMPEGWSLYGLGGILLAHCYLNLPFAARMLYLQLAAIPDTSWQLARQLKLSPWQRFSLIEWPSLRGPLLMLFGFVTVLCFNSFAVVLALGGGPQATTLEVAIYQSLKYEFNIPEALTLAWTQLLLAGLFFILLLKASGLSWLSRDTLVAPPLPSSARWKRQLGLTGYALIWLVLLAPLLALLPSLASIAEAKVALQSLAQALGNTLVLGFASALLAVAASYLCILPIRRAEIAGRRRSKLLVEWVATHSLIAPAMVISVGLYILLLRRVDLDQQGIYWVVILNAVAIVPYALQQMKPRLLQYDSQYSPITRNLKLNTLTQLRLEWPFIRQSVLAAFALVLLLAMGDVAVFSIFGGREWNTLPWLIYQYAGSYRLTEAAIGSLLLLAVCGLVVWLLAYSRRAPQPINKD